MDDLIQFLAFFVVVLMYLAGTLVVAWNYHDRYDVLRANQLKQDVLLLGYGLVPLWPVILVLVVLGVFVQLSIRYIIRGK